MAASEIRIDCGKIVARVEVLRLIFEHERLPFTTAVGAGGSVVIVPASYKNRLLHIMDQWQGAFIPCLDCVLDAVRATELDPVSYAHKWREASKT